MKKIIYFAFAFAMMTSCTKVEDEARVNKDVTCSASFNLSSAVNPNVSTSSNKVSVLKSAQNKNTTDAFLSKLTDFEIRNYHSFISLDDLKEKTILVNTLKISSTDGDKLTDAQDVSRFNMGEIKLGYNTFIASAIQGEAVERYTDLKDNDACYKHYVGITRTITSGDTYARTDKEYAFIPQNTNWPWNLYSISNKGANDIANKVVQNKILNITAKDITEGDYDKKIVMEMTPVNSVIALSAQNLREDLVMIFSTKTIIADEDPQFDNFIVENTTEKKTFFLNSEYLKVGAITTIKVYVAKVFSGKNIPVNISSMNNSEFRNHFKILNGKGEGQNIMLGSSTSIQVKGNQIYKNKTGIVLNKEDFTISADMLILFNKEWNENEITFDGWKW
ncbi:MAG: hypothetical protein WBG43_12505 [Marinifilaceae bacterium]